MLQHLIAIKLAAMASALGLNTDEWTKPSEAMKAQVQVLEDSVKTLNSVDTKERKGATAEDKQAAQAKSQKAIEEIKALAAKGDKDALFAMGLLTQRASQQGQGMTDVLDYYDRAAKANPPQLQAMNNHGFLVAASSNDPEKKKAGIAEIKLAADKGLGAAIRNMAQLTLRGDVGGKPDPAAALKLLESAKGDKGGETEWMLYQFYGGGGGEKYSDTGKAIEMLKAAAKAGNPNALDALGNFYLQGASGQDKKELIKADAAEAIKLFTELADAGNPVGQRKLAALLQNGAAERDKDGKVSKEYLKQDLDKSLEYYGKAAQGGDAMAQYQLGTMFESGVAIAKTDEKGNVVNDKDGKPVPDVKIPQNPGAALQFYKQAVQGNMPAAAFKVGQYYEQGVAVDRDLQKAFTFYMAAAQNGVSQAFQKVATAYAEGIGTTKDPVAAAGWFQRSAATGNLEAFLAFGVLTESGAALTPNPGASAEVIYRDAFNALQYQYQLAKNQPIQKGQEEALKNYLKQVLELTATASLRLASLHERGLTTNPAKPDLAKAYAWLTLAKKATDDKNEQIVKAHAAMAENKDLDKKAADAFRTSIEDKAADFIKEQTKKAEEAAKAAKTGTAAGDATPVTPPVETTPPPTPKGKGKGK